MAIVVSNGSEILVLKNYLNNTAPQDQVLSLYKNNIIPAESDTASTYLEADFTGYSSFALSGANWNFTSGDPSFAQYNVSFTFTGSIIQPDDLIQGIYGFWVVQASSGLLMWAERFDLAPFNIRLAGDSIQITLKLEAK